MGLFILGLCYVTSSGPLVKTLQGHHSHVTPAVVTCWASFLDVFETLPAGGKEPLKETMAG